MSRAVMMICGFVLSFSTLWSQTSNGLEQVEGLWRIEYQDADRGLVTGQAAIKAGQVEGFFFKSNGAVEVFRCDRFQYQSGRLEGDYYPYLLGVRIDLRRIGPDRLIGKWTSRGNVKEPGVRAGTRVYEKPEDPYWYLASGLSTWTRMIPQPRRIEVSSLSNDALDYPKMKENWANALVQDNLPMIAVDVFGEDLPTHYQANYFKLENGDDKLKFQSMKGFPSEGRIRMLFRLLEGALPGPKKMVINGRSMIIPLNFIDYEKKDGEYQVSNVIIDSEYAAREKRELGEEIEVLKARIADESALLQRRRTERAAVLSRYTELDQATKAMAAVLGPLLLAGNNEANVEPLDPETRSAVVRRNYNLNRIESLNQQIIDLAERARETTGESAKREASDLLAQIPTLEQEIVRCKEDLASVEASIAPYLKRLAESERDQKEKIQKINDQYFELDRRRDLLISELRTASSRVLDQELLLEGLGQSLNEAFAAQDSRVRLGTAVIEGLRVADFATDQTLYYSFLRRDPAKDRIELDELIAESESTLNATRDAYGAWRVEFEENFDEARFRLRLLGGATGRIMQGAGIQAASETIVYLHDLAADYDEGGLPLVVGDLLVKVIQATRGKVLSVDTLDEEQLRALRAVYATQAAEDAPRISGSQLASIGSVRAETEALNFGLKGPVSKAIKAAVQSGDRRAFEALRAGYSKHFQDVVKATRGLKPSAFRATYKMTIRPTLQSILESYIKDVANEKVKDYAKAREARSYADFFAADMLAIESFKFMSFYRDRYWAALDEHNELLRTSAELNEDLKGIDRDSKLQRETQLKFKAGTDLRIKVLYEGSSGAMFEEDVFLNGILSTPNADGSHRLPARFLTPADQGDVIVSVRSRPKVKK